MSEFKPSSVFIPECMASMCTYRSQRSVGEGGKGGGGKGRDGDDYE